MRLDTPIGSSLALSFASDHCWAWPVPDMLLNNGLPCDHWHSQAPLLDGATAVEGVRALRCSVPATCLQRAYLAVSLAARRDSSNSACFWACHELLHASQSVTPAPPFPRHASLPPLQQVRLSGMVGVPGAIHPLATATPPGEEAITSHAAFSPLFPLSFLFLPPCAYPGLFFGRISLD